jgi:lysozyme
MKRKTGKFSTFKKRFRYYLLLGGGLSCAAILGSGNLPKDSKKEYFDTYSIYGMDISKHTHKVDWTKVKEHDIRFVFLKSTEGSTYVDPKYGEFYREAKEHDIAVSAYHFFRFERSGKEQFENFDRVVDVADLDLIPVLDIEEAPKFNRPHNIPAVIKEIRRFLDLFEEKYGVKMILYSNEAGYNRYLKKDFPDYEIWITSFRYTPTIDRPWLFWQFSHTARIEGTRNVVDLNLFNGNEEQWEQYLSESRATLRSLRDKSAKQDQATTTTPKKDGKL